MENTHKAYEARAENPNKKRYGLGALADAKVKAQPLYPAVVTYDPELENTAKVDVGYILDDPFMCWPIENGGLMINGWDVDGEGGGFQSHSDTGVYIIKNKGTHPVTMKRRILPQSYGKVTAEFVLGVDTPAMRGSGVYFCSGQERMFGLSFGESAFILETDAKGPVELMPFIPQAIYGVRMEADFCSGRVSVTIDGRQQGQADFSAKTVDNVLVTTCEDGEGVLNLGYLAAFRGYAVNERFLTALSGKLPDDWQDEGALAAEIEEVVSEPGVDKYSLRLVSNDRGRSSVYKAFDAPIAKASCGFKFYAAKKGEAHFEFSVMSGRKRPLAVRVDGDNIYIRAGGSERMAYSYRPNVWFRVELIFNDTTGKTELFVNFKKAAELDFSFENGYADGISIEALDSADFLLDDIVVAPLTDLPDDYVPEPVPAKCGDTLVGMLRCDLWRTTDHLGWDRINNFDGNIRKPIMGWYEDGSPEAADWETKFMVEHGIAFQMSCWYRPYGMVGKPFKTPMHSAALHEGYFRSRYSHMLKFSLFITTGRGHIDGSRDFRENVVPFIIEYYLKDSRYLVVDNKPVIALYDYRAFRDDMGGTDEAAKAELDYLRDCCKEIGYDGAIYIASVMALSTEENREIFRSDCDLTCAYGWGLIFSDSASGQYAIAKDTRDYDGLSNLVGSLTVGFDFYPWDRSNNSSLISASDFKTACLLMRDRYLPTLENPLARKIIMIDNWNEFSEGHFINPTGVTGFGYLDAIREVFADGKAHTDTFPTKRQRDRIGVLYPQNRVLHPPARHPELPPVEECSHIVWRQDFADGSAHGFGPVTLHSSNCGHVSVTDGCLRIEPADRNFVCTTNTSLDLCADEIAYIRLLLRGDTSDFDGKLFYMLDSTDIDWKYGSRSLKLLNAGEGYTEYICDVGRGTVKGGRFFGGRLNGIQIWLYSCGRTVEIELIEALGR